VSRAASICGGLLATRPCPGPQQRHHRHDPRRPGWRTWPERPDPEAGQGPPDGV